MLLTSEEGPCQAGAFQGRGLGDDGAVSDRSASFGQCAAENGQEHYRCNDTLKCEEILDFGVGDAQEGQLEEEVKYESAHSSRGDSFAFGNVIWDVGEARPDCGEQNSHALSARCGLDTVKAVSGGVVQIGRRSLPKPDNGEYTT